MRWLALALAMAQLASSGHGGEEPALERAVWRGSIRTDGRYTDNFFDDGLSDDGSRGQRGRSEWITSLRAALQREGPKERLMPTLWELALHGELHRNFPDADFYEYATKVEWRVEDLRLGLRYRGSPQKLLFIDEKDDERNGRIVVLERRNVLYRQHVWGAEVGWKGFQPRPLLVTLGYGMEFRDFRPRFGEAAFRSRDAEVTLRGPPTDYDAERSFVSYEPSLEIEWRPTPLFRPRAGVDWERQAARSRNRTKAGFRLGAGFEGGWRRLSWGMSWSERHWDYDARGPRRDRNGDQIEADSNFAREDEKSRWAGWLGLRIWDGLSARVRYEHTDAVSTRQERNFDVNQITFGFAYTFGEDE